MLPAGIHTDGDVGSAVTGGTAAAGTDAVGTDAVGTAGAGGDDEGTAIAPRWNRITAIAWAARGPGSGPLRSREAGDRPFPTARHASLSRPLVARSTATLLDSLVS